MAKAVTFDRIGGPEVLNYGDVEVGQIGGVVGERRERHPRDRIGGHQCDDDDRRDLAQRLEIAEANVGEEKGQKEEAG